ncbi:uncharacterized protein LOC116255895 [Nymphaea colorata]|nr:uncharacterized protein LOC116255895 [Nymphaea colorata]
MGIKELLRFMKPFIHPVHIQKYKGKRVGIDAYSWLHKGAYACSMEICMNQTWGESRAPFIQYFMHRINLLRHHKIVPVVIFDGGCIPCKSATELERQRRRATNLSLAKEKLSQGDMSEAIEFFQKAVSITPSTAYQLIQILKAEQVEFIVAPYEADAQLAYLSKLEEAEGGISAVITEDSDLLAYGCRAVIFKMDRYGHGEEILMDDVLKSNACGLSFRNFDQELFTGMCVLAGCDFLPSVPGIGIKRAHLLVSKYRNLDRVLSILKFEKSRQMPEGYAEAFRVATAVFHHAIIYDSKRKVLMPLKELPEKLLEVLDNDVKFLGPMLDPSIAVAIAEGHINPLTFEAFCSSRPQINVDQEQSSFTIFSAEEMRVDATAERGTEEANHEANQNPDHHDDERFIREVAALGSLYAANSAAKSSQILMEDKEVAFPDNNPFSNKKRKKGDGVADERVTECKVSVVIGDLSRISNNEDSDDGGCGGCSSRINALGSPCATNSTDKSCQVVMKEKALSFLNNNPFSNNKKRKKSDDVACKKSGGEVVSVFSGSLSCVTSDEGSGNGGAGAGSNSDGLVDSLGSLPAANAVSEGRQIVTKGKPVGCLDEILFRNEKKRKKDDHGTDENFTDREEKIVLREPLSCVTSDEDSINGGRRGGGGDGLVNDALISDSQKSVNSRPAKSISSKNRRSRKVVSGKDGGILKFFARL